MKVETKFGIGDEFFYAAGEGLPAKAAVDKILIAVESDAIQQVVYRLSDGAHIAEELTLTEDEAYEQLLTRAQAALDETEGIRAALFPKRDAIQAAALSKAAVE